MFGSFIAGYCVYAFIRQANKVMIRKVGTHQMHSIAALAESIEVLLSICLGVCWWFAYSS